MSKPVNRRHLLLATAGMILPGGRAFAGAASSRGSGLDISPILLALGPVGESTICTVDNPGDTAVMGQIRIKSWRQVGGQDVLEDTTAVAASPPIMTVDPGERQIVRLVNLAAAPGPTEQAFRLLLNELPNADTATGFAVRVLIGFSLPVFIPGAGSAPPALQAAFVATPAGIVLRLANHGDIHARLSDLKCRDRTGRPLLQVPELAGYVLCRSTRDFATGLRGIPAPGGTVTVQTQMSITPTLVPLVESMG
jgi:fimbrial chaperone protein